MITPMSIEIGNYQLVQAMKATLGSDTPRMTVRFEIDAEPDV